jgi:hypothetical protein
MSGFWSLRTRHLSTNSFVHVMVSLYKSVGSELWLKHPRVHQPLMTNSHNRLLFSLITVLD